MVQDRQANEQAGALIGVTLVDATINTVGPLPLEARIRAAVDRCIARWGMTKTTIDDIAREAGCSRATIYRVFPGGKDTVMMATFAAEVSQFLAELAEVLQAESTLEDVLVVTLSRSCREITGDDALQYLLEHEPEAVMPFVSFDGLDPLLDWARGFAVPALARFVDETVAAELGEWIARVVVTYAFDRGPTLPFDFTDVDVARRFVRTFIMPGIVPGDPDPETTPQSITHA